MNYSLARNFCLTSLFALALSTGCDKEYQMHDIYTIDKDGALSGEYTPCFGILKGSEIQGPLVCDSNSKMTAAQLEATDHVMDVQALSGDPKEFWPGSDQPGYQAAPFLIKNGVVYRTGNYDFKTPEETGDDWQLVATFETTAGNVVENPQVEILTFDGQNYQLKSQGKGMPRMRIDLPFKEFKKPIRSFAQVETDSEV